MNVTITNISPSPVYLSDLYTTIPAGGSVTTKRFESDLSRMKSVQDALAAGTVTVSAVPTANEQASGMLAGLGVAEAIPSTTPVGSEFDIRVPLTAGVAGTPDDVVVYALNAVPYKFRVLDSFAVISTAVAASTLQARTQAAGAGTLLAEVSSAAVGHVDQDATVTVTQVVTPGTMVGLFIRRSDRGVGGEIVLHCRREA